jgi:hypothetical protein
MIEEWLLSVIVRAAVMSLSRTGILLLLAGIATCDNILEEASSFHPTDQYHIFCLSPI